MRIIGKSSLVLVISLAVISDVTMGFTDTASAAETEGGESYSYVASLHSDQSFTSDAFDPGSPDNPVPAHHFDPYSTLAQCNYAIDDQSGSKNVARGCLKENDGHYYYWG